MSIRGVGTDIESVETFRKSKYKDNMGFYSRIFTKEEIEYCLNKSDPYPHFTARFSAKEAFVKAFGEEVKDLREIELVLEAGRPKIKMERCEGLNVYVSLSHSYELANAIVVIEDNVDDELE